MSLYYVHRYRVSVIATIQSNKHITISTRVVFLEYQIHLRKMPVNAFIKPLHSCSTNNISIFIEMLFIAPFLFPWRMFRIKSQPCNETALCGTIGTMPIQTTYQEYEVCTDTISRAFVSLCGERVGAPQFHSFNGVFS